MHAQFSTSSGDSSASYDPSSEVSSAFEVRRLRIEADVRFGDRVFMRLSPAFEMASLRMRDAYLRVTLARTPSSSLALTMGQEKKPFNRYALTSSNTLPSIERGFRLRGFTGVAPTLNNLLDENGYAEHDIGANAEVSAASGRVVLKAGIYNGSGESSVDVNGAKTFGGRLAATVRQDAERRPMLRAGLALVSRDRAVTTGPATTAYAPDSSRRHAALGVDLEWGDFRPGLHVIADAALGTTLRGGALCGSGATATSCGINTGRNTGNVRAGTPDSAFARFASVQVIAAWRWQPDDSSGTRLVQILEPALRVDVTDPDRDRAGDRALLVTPVLNVYFTPTTMVRIGVDFFSYRDANGTKASARAVRIAWQSSF